MKVVINDCYGGFNLSDKAIEECIARGMTVTEFTPEGYYKDPQADFVDWSSHRENLRGSRYSCCHDHDNAFRSNPIVVDVVRKLKDKANGFCAKLKIVDIPFDGVEGWHIDEYDGLESICESHRSWS